MRRGDIVLVALQGSYGKPRPAVVVQVDLLEGSESVIVCPTTSELLFRAPHRLELPVGERTGLVKVSLVMTDKIQAAPRSKCIGPIGRLDSDEQRFIDAALMFVLGLDS